MVRNDLGSFPKSWDEVSVLHRAFISVLGLHAQQIITLPNGEWGFNCAECDGYEYPCSTIQAIEKELA